MGRGISNLQNEPVVIVGGGPVGLALAGDLGQRGIASILLEQSDGAILQPKMDGVNVRTMEFCRRWGIRDWVRNCDYPRNYPQDMVYLTSFNGFELGRESFATPSGGAEERLLAVSPEVRVRCPQNLFDPILRRFAEAQTKATLRYRCKFLSFEQDDAGVLVQAEDLETDRKISIRGSFLVGCDGGASSVREQLGIAMEGPGSLTWTTNVIFRCTNLPALHNKQLGYRHIFIGPEGTWGTIVAINGRDQWRLSIIGTQEPRKMSEAEVRAAINRAVGQEFEYEIVSTVPWVRRELVAANYGVRRVFLAGDSAHVMSPTGGFGMNTGIADAVDLSWKLAAVLAGWGSTGLLNSYEVERRPVAQRAAREASGNLLRTMSPGSNPRLLERGLEGALLRYAVGRQFSATMLREWYKLGIDLGYTYEQSPICWAEEIADDSQSDHAAITASAHRELHKLALHKAEGYDVKASWEELPPETVMLYHQNARPGSRAPHVWMAEGRSTLDMFGPDFTLLRLGKRPPSGAALVAAAASRRVPFKVVDCRHTEVARAYERALVLVRPDGHVAWRGDDLPDLGSEALIDRVRGIAAPQFL